MAGVSSVLAFPRPAVERSNVNLVFSVSPPKLTWIVLKVMPHPVLSLTIPPESQTPLPSPATRRGHSDGRVMNQPSPPTPTPTPHPRQASRPQGVHPPETLCFFSNDPRTAFWPMSTGSIRPSLSREPLSKSPRVPRARGWEGPRGSGGSGALVLKDSRDERRCKAGRGSREGPPQEGPCPARSGAPPALIPPHTCRQTRRGLS